MSQNQLWNLFAKKMAGEASDEELKELENLFKNYSDSTYAAQHIEDIWKLEPEKDIDHSEQAFKNHINRLIDKKILLNDQVSDGNIKKQRTIAFKNVFNISMVVLFIFIICIAIQMFFSRSIPKSSIINKNTVSEVNTKPGSKIHILLPDSTMVWLNSGSKLTYGNQFGLTNRNVLLSGEAFFYVKHSQIPFIIHTQSIQIKVMGTEFNVRSYPNEKLTETSLIRGKVEITLDKRPEQSFILKPNEKLLVKNEIADVKKIGKETRLPIFQLSVLTRSKDSSIQETSWVFNRLVFEDESFNELAAKIERWYGVSIKFEDVSLENLRFTGVFEKETIQQAMEALQITANFHFKIYGNSIFISH